MQILTEIDYVNLYDLAIMLGRFYIKKLYYKNLIKTFYDFKQDFSIMLILIKCLIN